jgi:hypothetical protein
VRPEKRWDRFREFIRTIPQGSRIAELGVYRGKAARGIYETVKPEIMYLVDWWAPYSNTREAQPFWDDIKRQALQEFKAEIESKKAKVIHESFATAAIRIPGGYLDFIRHDGDERESQVRQCLEAWWRTLKVGGIWMGHGFHNEKFHGTIPAVVEFLRRHPEAEMLGVIKDCSHYVLRRNA